MAIFVGSSAGLCGRVYMSKRKQIQVGVSFILLLAILMMATTSGINQYLFQNFTLTHHRSIINYPNVTDLYRIMQKQFDVQHGKFEGVAFKKILYWNSMASLNNYEQFGMGVGREKYQEAGCPVWQCETSQDRTDLLSYDAILFHYRDWHGNDKPQIRSPNQRYIFVMKESPAWPWPEDGVYSQVKGIINQF